MTQLLKETQKNGDTEIKRYKWTCKAQTKAKYAHKKHTRPNRSVWTGPGQWSLCTWKTSNVQRKCQGPLQLLSSPFLKTDAAERKGGGQVLTTKQKQSTLINI